MLHDPDLQRDLVYRAEAYTYWRFDSHPFEPHGLSRTQMQAIADAGCSHFRVDPVLVEIDADAEHPHYVYPEDRIVIPDVTCARALVVTHEISHHVVACLACDRQEFFEAHGPEFCAVWVELTRAVVHRDVSAHLARSFARTGVRVSAWPLTQALGAEK